MLGKKRSGERLDHMTSGTKGQGSKLNDQGHDRGGKVILEVRSHPTIANCYVPGAFHTW